jgi:hypothetical protein
MEQKENNLQRLREHNEEDESEVSVSIIARK